MVLFFSYPPLFATGTGALPVTTRSSTVTLLR